MPLGEGAQAQIMLLQQQEQGQEEVGYWIGGAAGGGRGGGGGGGGGGDIPISSGGGGVNFPFPLDATGLFPAQGVPGFGAMVQEPTLEQLQSVWGPPVDTLKW